MKLIKIAIAATTVLSLTGCNIGLSKGVNFPDDIDTYPHSYIDPCEYYKYHKKVRENYQPLSSEEIQEVSIHNDWLLETNDLEILMNKDDGYMELVNYESGAILYKGYELKVNCFIDTEVVYMEECEYYNGDVGIRYYTHSHLID